MKTPLKISIFLLFLFICAAAWIWREAVLFLQTPPEAKGREVYFDVPHGAHMGQIANDLAAKGLITDSRKFIWLARYKNMDNRLKAGRFSLNTGWRPDKTLDALVNGTPVLYRVTIPEGLPWWQTARLLEEEGLVRFDDFKQVIADADFLRHYGIPFASAEGFLMPDTYLMRKPDVPMPKGEPSPEDTPEQLRARNLWQSQARSVAGRMIDNFWRKADPLWPKAKDKKDAMTINRPERDDLKKWVILASIVEKETGLASERGTVAGVYTNRIAKNMLLQADPTVIYGLGEKFSGKLRRAHLEDATNPYNTYQRAGLPPGPICSFGVAALKAAIHPQKHDFLYFVAITDSIGGHNFSRTYEEHNRAVQAYRRQKQDR